jgi:hypothetical protein
MKKILLWFGYAMPFFISIFIFLNFYKFKNVEKSPEQIEEQSTQKEKLFEDWLDSKISLLSPEYFDNIKIKKENKILYFKQLDTKKQDIFKMMIYCKAQKDCEYAFLNKDEIYNDQYSKLVKLQKDLNVKIREQKKKVYNIYGSTMHPLDKKLLESFDVYFFN